MASQSVACPHCAHEFADTHISAHVAHCPCRPDMRARIIAAMTAPDGYAVSQTQYEAVSLQLGVPSRTLLWHTFGSWSKALVYFGLTMNPANAACINTAKRERPPKRPYRRRNDAAVDARVGAEIDEAREAAQRAQALARYEVDHGYTVAVRQDGTPYVRTLPGGSTAYMLR